MISGGYMGLVGGGHTRVGDFKKFGLTQYHRW